jgi:hypothetical protein
MARVFMCDHCGEHEAITGMGNQRPAGWSSVRITVRTAESRSRRGEPTGTGEPVQGELCPKCTPELAGWMGKKL